MYGNCKVLQLVTKSQVLPSYLERFETNRVHLIFAKKPSISSESEDPSEDVKKEIVYDDESFAEQCDLTGNPLEVDLGDNNSLQLVKFEEPTQKWAADESNHFPLPVRDARRELNRILKKAKPESDCCSTYIVCNADDSKKTVLLGGNCIDLMACSVHVLGTIRQSDVEKEIEEMVEEHLRNYSTGDGQVEYLVKITYNLYARSLQNALYQNTKMRQLSTHGSVYVDIITPRKVFKASETDEFSMKMHMEIVAGHKLLSLNCLWRELVKLQGLIDILSDSQVSTCDETVICEDPLDHHVILQTMVQLLSWKFLKREPEKDVCLDNLRQEDLLDGLWNVLSRCENLSTLRDSFTFLFEELAEEGSMRVLPIKDDSSKISRIIRGIFQGKIGLSVISLPESIEFLFELGAQKLKFDFQVILTQFNPHTKATIDSIWKSFSQGDIQDIRKTRRTRATRGVNHLGIQGTTLVDQLAYLSQLYVGSEFIYLLKDQVNLSDDGFCQVCRCLEEEYVSERGHIVDFNDIFQSPLNKMSVELELRNASFLESVCPSRWTMSMETGGETTIYDLSDSPIFPTVIYDYDVELSDNDNVQYFVSKMRRSTGWF